MNPLQNFNNINEVITTLIENQAPCIELDHYTTHKRGIKHLHVPLVWEGIRSVEVVIRAKKSGRVLHSDMRLKGEGILEDFLVTTPLATILEATKLEVPEYQVIEGCTYYSVKYKVFGTNKPFTNIVLIKDSKADLYTKITDLAKGKETLVGLFNTFGADFDGDTSSPNKETISLAYRTGQMNNFYYFMTKPF